MGRCNCLPNIYTTRTPAPDLPQVLLTRGAATGAVGALSASRACSTAPAAVLKVSREPKGDAVRWEDGMTHASCTAAGDRQLRYQGATKHFSHLWVGLQVGAHVVGTLERACSSVARPSSKATGHPSPRQAYALQADVSCSRSPHGADASTASCKPAMVGMVGN